MLGLMLVSLGTLVGLAVGWRLGVRKGYEQAEQGPRRTPLARQPRKRG